MSQHPTRPGGAQVPALFRRRPAQPPAPQLTDGVSETCVAYNCQIELEKLPPPQALRVTEYLRHLAQERLDQFEALTVDHD